MVGRELDVLVESREPSKSAGGDPIVVGRTMRDAPEVDGLALLKGTFPAGTIVRAVVRGALPYDLLCDPLDALAPTSTVRAPRGSRGAGDARIRRRR